MTSTNMRALRQRQRRKLEQALDRLRIDRERETIVRDLRVSKLPKRAQAEVWRIVGLCLEGATLADLGGKPMRHDRTLCSIPIGRKWRVMVRKEGPTLTPVRVLSHEAYSRGKRAGSR